MGSSRRDEPSLRLELTQAIAILERSGIIDFNGHFSVRLDDGTILINTGDSVRSRITPEDFVVVGANGEISEHRPRPPAELPLHIAVYQARPDVRAVVHGHPKWSTLLSSAGRDYQIVMPQGALLGEVPVYPSPMSVNNSRIAGAIAKKLGSRRAALLRSHGSVVAGNDVLEVTVLAIYLELNAERQVMGAGLGAPYVFTPEETASLQKGLEKRGLFEKCWNYYLAKYNLSHPVA
jgi:L-fuculose-phosphate aldolase